MKALFRSRPVVWLALALPALWIAWRWAWTPKTYGFGHAIGDSGDWAVWLLMLTMAVTPIRLLWRRNAISVWLAKHRRDLGVASFAYAAIHTGIYLSNRLSLTAILDDLELWEIATGWLALLLFVPLAVTSNDIAMRAMKRAWKRLHRLVYPAAVLTFVHWALAAFDPTTAYIHMGILAAIEGIRLTLQRRQSVT